MECLPNVSYSTGTMNSLVGKLAEMISNSTEEFSDLAQEFKKAVLGLKEDFFDKLAVPNVCMKQVRELVFEIEDWIDLKPGTKMLDPASMEEMENFMSEIKEARERFTWYNDLLKIVPAEPDLVLVAPSNIITNPLLLVEEKSCHDLFDGIRDELIKHLTNKEEEEMRKVVSVVGMEGIGKTSLAKDIYSELQVCQLFECQAFVSVTRRRPMTEILDDILCQVKPWSDIPASIVSDVQEVITELQEYLNSKRYFILIDGMWSTWAWEVINCALPNNRGSRILTTTCSMDVGKSCSSYPNDLVYQMEALCQKNSQILFHSIVTFQEEEKGASFAAVSDYILNICSGMPLAIIVAAGLLARKSKELAELKMLGESIYSSLKYYSTSEGMTKILHMSYADLCLALRSCFLYLGVFPENYIIKKDHLIRLWGAEGFIPRIDEECLLVTGERYFNELTSRRLIQPVFTCDDDQAVGCTVHIVILDFIRSMSREENYAIMSADLNSGPFPCDTIRRFSLDCGHKDEAVTLSTSSMHLSSIRSLIVFGDLEGVLDDEDYIEMYDHPPRSVSRDEKGMFDDTPVSRDDEGMFDYPSLFEDDDTPPSVSRDDEGMFDDHPVSRDDEGMSDYPSLYEYGDPPPSVSENDGLSAFKLLRVLDLEDTRNLQNHHLKGIEKLVLLRYLGLRGTGITVLPENIGDLGQLETLDLRWDELKTFPKSTVKLPASVVKLEKLTHLLLNVDGAEIWGMPELEEASDVLVHSSNSLANVIELLRKSDRLRMLGLTLEASILTETDLLPLFNEIVKSKLQSLSLNFQYGDYEPIPLLEDSWEKVTAPLEKKFEPRRFELRISYLKGVHPNMASVASLTHLHISLHKAKAEDLHVLGGLTNLVFLRLFVSICPKNKRIIIKKGMFPCLKVFFPIINHQDRWIGIELEEGAMPQLQRIVCTFRASAREDQEYPGIGLEHLTCLTHVLAGIYCIDATVSEVEAAEAAIRAQISKIPTRPTLELERVVPHFRTEVPKETSIQQLEVVDKGRHSILAPSICQVSDKSDESRPESTIEGAEKMWKDKPIHFVPSNKQVSENVEKRKLHRSISSLSEKMKNMGRKLIGRPKFSENSNKHILDSSIEEEDQMRKAEGKHSIPSKKN